jgi:hypothetical protein
MLDDQTTSSYIADTNDNKSDEADNDAEHSCPASDLFSTGVDPDGDSLQVSHEVGVFDTSNVPPNPIGEVYPIPPSMSFRPDLYCVVMYVA